MQCVALGDRAVVCLDTGHHAQGTKIEFIVMQFLRLGRLGSFDSTRVFYAADLIGGYPNRSGSDSMISSQVG